MLQKEFDIFADRKKSIITPDISINPISKQSPSFRFDTPHYKKNYLVESIIIGAVVRMLYFYLYFHPSSIQDDILFWYPLGMHNLAHIEYMNPGTMCSCILRSGNLHMVLRNHSRKSNRLHMKLLEFLRKFWAVLLRIKVHRYRQKFTLLINVLRFLRDISNMH